MDVAVVREVRLERDPSLVVAVVAEGGEQIIDADAVEALGASPSELWGALTSQRAEIARRVELYRLHRFHVDLHGFIAIVVIDVLDDPLVAALACRVARMRGARRVVIAAPIGTADTYTYISHHTFRTHVKNILTKLGAHSSIEAVSIAVCAGVRPSRMHVAEESSESRTDGADGLQ
jgi:predicted phosphoribosyltransferase